MVLGDVYLFYYAFYDFDVGFGEVFFFGGGGDRVLFDRDVDVVVYKVFLVVVFIYRFVVYLVGVTVYVFTIVTVFIVIVKMNEGFVYGIF